MDDKVQLLLRAILSLPRQIYLNSSLEGNVNDKLASLLISRYRRLASDLPNSEHILPTSEKVRNCLKGMPEQKSFALSAMVEDIAHNMPVNGTLSPMIHFEWAIPDSKAVRNVVLNLRADMRLSQSKFNWDFFLLNLFMDQFGYAYGFYLIVNQQVECIRKKLEEYYSQNLYASYNAGNLFFLLKRDYEADLIIINANGEIVVKGFALNNLLSLRPALSY